MAEPSIKTNVSATSDGMGKKAARHVAEAIRAFPPTSTKPFLVIGLATGSTQKSFYKELVRLYEEEGLDFSRVVFFNLDEYVGLPKDHPQSYHSEMQRVFFDHLHDPARQPHAHYLLDGNAADLTAECAAYEQKIRALGGIDIQMLGIGENGHIGFMEPGTPFDSRTQPVKLAESTRQANKRFFDDKIDQVPTHALSMGLGTIAQAREILLLADTIQKAPALTRTLLGEKTEHHPASILRDHPHATFYLAYPAARNIGLKDYLYAGAANR